MGATNCPETPRQRMISMMYLVLTALLALNVSKEIINAFVVVDKGLLKTNENILKNNTNLQGEFSKQYTLSKEKVQKFYNKAILAKQYTDNIIAFTKELKREVIAKTEFGDKNLKETTYEVEENGKTIEKKCKVEDFPLEKISAKDNFDKPMEILIGFTEDGSNGKGMELKKKIDDYKNKMLSLFDDIPGVNKNAINIGLNTDDEYNEDLGRKGNWSFNNFHHTILAADIVLFDKLIAEVMNAENSIVTKLMESISVQDFKFDKVGAKVIPRSNYVIQGDKYQADIIVAAYSSTEKPLAYIRVGADTLPANQVSGAQSIANVSNGVVKYEVPASGLGDQKFAGVIQLRKPGSEEYASYYFKSSYTVAKPTAIVAATKMNVFYIGVDNPVEISVPGIADTKVKPSISSGCTLAKDPRGGYIVRCTPGSRTATVNVAADMGSNKSQSMGKSEFRVKPVPDPVATVGNVEGGPIAKSTLMAGGAIIPVMKNFDFNLNFIIKSFTFTVSVGGDLVEKSATGNILTAEMKRLIQASNRGQKIFIDDIKAVGPDGTTRKLSPINLKLM